MNTLKCIIPPALVAASATTYYTSPAGTRCAIKKLTVCNPTANVRIVTIYLIVKGGSASDTNTISKTVYISPYQTWECYEAEGHVLEAEGFLQAVCDVASTVSIRGTGLELIH